MVLALCGALDCSAKVDASLSELYKGTPSIPIQEDACSCRYVRFCDNQDSIRYLNERHYEYRTILFTLQAFLGVLSFLTK